ncbi:MAG TPA: transcriptional regulator NrdR [Candidatus Latescibacteria bacterium]|jgi:transcriptional repressor NrdR|nr:transcriptional regulator NrdR [Gemmatimonadota bacterium]MDP6983171.1 transcriptional regulator NrdR [Candidatus Latescibacterota bacterium]MBU10380.1 transcriptional regulator NrdR [Gemmatimonadota bacterium]MDP7363936.1 transcriptional regulator NrdR [Candidatus Latescibacterota bacterium]MDP7635012.1 transcriptional regulator NrdR [Candidatus Latescibacterota bacterium]|tara:strand:- start:34 stop:483 length:450 start_codon:yes stop_codon:yes gene_type:complete
MRCPFCNHQDDRVVDSRSCRDGQAIRRRRECTNCDNRFTTYEYIEHAPLTVIKRDGNREPFDRSKLQKKIELACYKTTVSAERMEELIDQVESDLSNLAEREVPSKQIGELVMEALKELNDVAYVRYASVYRQFKDRSDFMRELEQMAN